MDPVSPPPSKKTVLYSLGNESFFLEIFKTNSWELNFSGTKLPDIPDSIDKTTEEITKVHLKIFCLPLPYN